MTPGDQGPRRFVRMFKPRFAALVASGKKRQTIRPLPKRMPKVGDILDAREWSGKAYRSPQRKLGEYTISAIHAVTIRPWNFEIAGLSLTHPRNTSLLDRAARADGFADFGEMFEWFEREHGLPFSGILIEWE